MKPRFGVSAKAYSFAPSDVPGAASDKAILDERNRFKAELEALRKRNAALSAALNELQDIYCSGRSPSPADHDALMARVNEALR